MEQNNNITPDTREYEGRRYRLVTDEIGDNHECKRCPLNDKCDSEHINLCYELFGEDNCTGKRLEDVTDLLAERVDYNASQTPADPTADTGGSDSGSGDNQQGGGSEIEP